MNAIKLKLQNKNAFSRFEKLEKKVQIEKQFQMLEREQILRGLKSVVKSDRQRNAKS